MKLVRATSAPWGNADDWLMPANAPNARIAKTARVSDFACVSDFARVSDFACVSDSARVRGQGAIAKTEDYLVISPIGSRNDFITLHRDLELEVRIVAGCWNGPLAEFLARLRDCPEHALYRELIPVAHAALLRRMTPIADAEKTK